MLLVCHIPVEDTQLMLSYCDTVGTYSAWWTKYLESWNGIKRGSDLFLKGCGSFDIMSAYEKAILHHRRKWIGELLKFDAKKVYKWKLKAHVHIREWSSSLKSAILGEHTKAKDFNAMEDLFAEDQRLDLTQLMRGMDKRRDRREYRLSPWWLLSVEELQAWGHFPDALCMKGQDFTFFCLKNILSQGNDCQVRKHLINYHDYWNDPEHAGSLDELYYLAVGHKIYQTGCGAVIEPPDGCATMHPRQLLNAVREELRKVVLGEDITYHWLGGLKDDRKNGLKVLRSKYEIDDDAQRMHNCALSHASKVETKKFILILLEDKNRKAVAMGEYQVDSKEWTQVSGVSNKQPTNEVIDKFNRYGLQTIRPWLSTEV